MRRQTFATLAILLLALLFGWETRQALRSTPGGPDNAATAPAGVWRPGASVPDPPPLPDPTSAAAAISSRPLFRQDRQPFRGDAASARNFEAELARYTLLGVLGMGDASFGVVVGKVGNKGERWEVKSGDSLQGFTVKEVGVEGLRLTAEGREFLLPLYAGPPTAATGAVRTEVPRRDAAPPPAPPGSATPTKPGAPPASAAAAPARPAGFPPAASTTAVAPAPAPNLPPLPARLRSPRGRR